MAGTLVSLGSINADFQLRVNDALSDVETQLATGFARRPGGKAANTAYIGALFGHRSVLLGRVGNDDLAEQALAPLRAAGVELSGVSRSHTESTAVSMIVVPPDGKKQIVLAANANDEWDPAALDVALEPLNGLAAPACLVVDCEVPTWVVEHVVQQAHRLHIPVILDPSFPDRVPPALLHGLTAITPNCEEVAALLGLEPGELNELEALAHAARELCARGVKLACIKLADGGAVMAHEQRVFYVPAAEVNVVDSTGAGDAFTAVLAVTLLEGLAPLETVAWAVAAAQQAVTGYGSQEAYADREHLEALAGQRFFQARELLND